MILYLLLAFLGCASPTHLQYDHGRSFYQTIALQSDLTRSTVPAYGLSGEEAAAIRMRVQESSTDKTESLPSIDGN